MLAIAILSAGCAAHRAPPPAPGYDRLFDALDSVDPSGLQDKRIVLDPGHGGHFPGSLGVRGLTEARVNLGVALVLRDLLQAQGARVLMTRDSDRDFLTPADSTLRFDLAERVRIANAFEPDLFVSIHHNADASGRHDVNEIQTYYKLGDEGPSLDVAQDVHRALVRNIGIKAHKVVPGNYFVVRNSTAPALLTETSYLTYPPVEERLRLPEKQALEAQALYLGIARYFARPLPRIAEFMVWDPDSARADTAFAGALEVRARIAGEFDVAELRVNDAVVPAVRTGDLIVWRPAAPLPQGRHRASIRVRRTGIGSARDRAIAFSVRRHDGWKLDLDTRPKTVPAQGGTIGIRVTALDSAGLPDPLGPCLTIRTSASDSSRATPSRSASVPRRRTPLQETVTCTRDGVAWEYVDVASGSDLAVGAEVRGDSIRARKFELTVPRGGESWSGFLRLMPHDSALAGVRGTREPAPALSWLNRDGFATLERNASGAPRVPQLPGYRRWADDGSPAFTAIAGGALHGRRIVLDADAGGDQSGGVGKGGTRAANVNLEVARALAALLVAAGAEVRLTREGDAALAELERVQISEAFRAERYLRIGHRAEPARIGHYFSSTAGRAWAGRVAAECGRLGLRVPRIAEDAQYPLQQTSCPSLYASLARIDDPASEDRLLAPGALRAEAYVLWLALAREWGSDQGWSADSVIVRDSAGRPVSAAAVRLGGALLVETDERGIARFVRTEAGPIEVAVEDRRVYARRVLLDSDHGTVLTGPPAP